MFDNWLSFSADVIGIGIAIGSLVTAIKVRNFQKYEKERLDQKITIRLVQKDEAGIAQAFINIPGKMRREEMTRGEVLGWIGMLPMRIPRARFTIVSLSTKEFLEKMNEIQAAYGDRLFEIDCTEEELMQFRVKEKVPGQVELEIDPEPPTEIKQ
jgi:hypothetical protein